MWQGSYLYDIFREEADNAKIVRKERRDLFIEHRNRDQVLYAVFSRFGKHALINGSSKTGACRYPFCKLQVVKVRTQTLELAFCR